MDINTSFKDNVYALVRRIPKGYVTTYKHIANELETNAYQAVGVALAHNTDTNTPCHRVIKTDRTIGGYFGSVDEDAIQNKKQRLQAEGVQIIDNKVDKSCIYCF